MHLLASYIAIATCVLYSQLQVTEFPCVVFAPEQYKTIYNRALEKANLTETAETAAASRENINILLHDMLDYAGDVVNLVTKSISIELPWIV